MSGDNADKRRLNRIEVITSVAAVVVLYVILESFGVTCPIKYITGISCAGCGMSRAWISLLHFNIHEAFMYHPLFFLPPVVVIFMLLKSKINIKFYKIFMFTMAGAFVLLSLITCGIYAWFWYYNLGNRLAANGPRYGLSIQENGTTVLLWQIFGAFICGIGPFVAMHILIKNSNKICNAYNRAQGLM